MRIGLLLLLLPITLGASAQWEWTQAIQSSSPEFEAGHASRLCPDRGVASAGWFRNQAQFDGITLQGGYPNQNVCYVVKHDSLGAAQWAHAITNTENSGDLVTYGIDVDDAGNVFIGGHGRDTVLLDGNYLHHNTSGLNNAQPWFVIKFSADGAMLWSTTITATNIGGELWSLAVDPNGDAWACGMISNIYAAKFYKLSGADGALLFESAQIPGRAGRISVDAAGDVFVRGQAPGAFTLDGITCPFNNVMGGTTSTWTGKFNSNGVAQWFQVADQGNSGYSPWSTLNAASTANGQCFVEAFGKTRINGDTISFGSYDHGLYLVDAAGAPIWWKRINQSGIIYVQDLSADPDGGCWVTGRMQGIVDLVDTVVNHNGLFLFHYDQNGNILDRVYGPAVEDCYSVDAGENEVVIGGAYATAVSFGDIDLTGNVRAMFAARYALPFDVGVEERTDQLSVVAYPNPARDVIRLLGTSRGPLTVEVLDVAGRRLLQVDGFNPASDALDLAHLPEGLLFLRVGTTVGQTTQPVIHVH